MEHYCRIKKLDGIEIGNGLVPRKLIFLASLKLHNRPIDVAINIIAINGISILIASRKKMRNFHWLRIFQDLTRKYKKENVSLFINLCKTISLSKGYVNYLLGHFPLNYPLEIAHCFLTFSNDYELKYKKEQNYYVNFVRQYISPKVM